MSSCLGGPLSLLPPSTSANPVLFSIPERHHPWCPFKLQRKQNIAHNLEANYTWFHFKCMREKDLERILRQNISKRTFTFQSLLIFLSCKKLSGLLGGSVVKNPPANAGDAGSIPGSGRSPEEEWYPSPVFLPGKPHGQRSLAGYSPEGCKESDTTAHCMQK